MKVLRGALDQDRTKTFTAEISKLGLVEMTRQNVTEGVREIISRTCPTCDGDAVVLSEETIAIEFDRKLRELAARAPRSVEAFLVKVHPDVSIEFTGVGARMLHELEEATGKVFHFEGSDSLPYDHFEIVMEGTVEEVRERAVPFQEGEEVLVTIVEPHMYNVDDAVAKIDGYVVSVTRRRAPYRREAARADRGGRAATRRARRSSAPADASRRRDEADAAAADGRGRRATIEASAPRPQRRAAPFGCHGGCRAGGRLHQR